MNFVKLDQVSFAYENLSKNILNDVSLTFAKGWTSVCGVNGSGKSTLMKLITNELIPTSGSIQIIGKCHYVPQSTEEAPTGLDHFRDDGSAYAYQLRIAFGIDDGWFERWERLSIGERKRLQIACALSFEPTVLIVDEPTNHVDQTTKTRILKELKNFRGIGILISHDRLLLNELCSTTVFLNAGNAVMFKAGYDVAFAELNALHTRQKNTREKIKGELSQLRQASQIQAEKVDQSKRKLSKSGLSKKDKDGRSKVESARNLDKDGRDSRKKKVIESKIQRSERSLSEIGFEKEYKLGIQFGEIKRPRNLVIPEGRLETSFLSIDYPDVFLLPGEKLALVGDNGSGKTTLMKHFASQTNTPDMTFAEQELTTESQRKLMEDIQDLSPEEKGKFMTLVSCFGSDPKPILAGSIPSPGVWQKMLIAKGIVVGSPMMFLDEPTNHMDLPAIHLLEEALQSYKGVLVLVSHDGEFVANVCSQTLELKRAGLKTQAMMKS